MTQRASSFAAVFAGFAALASSVQAYVSWTGRNDIFKAAVASSAAGHCSAALVATNRLQALFHAQSWSSNRDLRQELLLRFQDDFQLALQNISVVLGDAEILGGLDPILYSKFRAATESVTLFTKNQYAEKNPDFAGIGNEVANFAPLIQEACRRMQKAIIDTPYNNVR